MYQPFDQCPFCSLPSCCALEMYSFRNIEEILADCPTILKTNTFPKHQKCQNLNNKEKRRYLLYLTLATNVK